MIYDGQAPELEARAIARLQTTSVEQLDANLPARPFASWFKQLVGPRAGVTWQLTDCGELPGPDAEKQRDIPACVEVSAILPNERKAVVVVWVGTFNLGATGKPQLHFALVEENGELHSVKRLSELPTKLRGPLPTAAELARQRRLEPPALAPRKGNATAARPLPAQNPPVAFDKLPSLNTVAEPPPAPVAVRISQGVSLGQVIERALPVYPLQARQNNVTGEVQVEVSISEQGQVLLARALSGHALLRPAAEAAARKWIFKPSLLNGIPVKVQGTLIFVFSRP